MTRFEDGPAAGQVLSLTRAPIFLRVVLAPDGKVDALDLLEDTPAQDEKLFAYQRVGEAGMMHVRRSGGRGGWYTVADYRLVKDQPAESDMRSNAAWAKWTGTIGARLFLPPQS